jgi:hypothetical protein
MIGHEKIRSSQQRPHFEGGTTMAASLIELSFFPA